MTKVNVCGGKHDGTECTILRPQLLKRFLTVTLKSSQIYAGHLRHFLPITTATIERSFSALRRLIKNLPEVHDEGRSLEWTCCYAYPQALDVSFSAKDIVEDFAASGNRRMELLFQLLGLTVTSICGERRFFIVVLRSIS